METRTAVALKLEHIDAWPSMLRNELHVYRSLAGQPGIPSVHWEGEECEYRVMVLDLLGPSLEDLLTFCGGRFSLKTTLMLADQLIHRFQRIHSKGFVHRDIKADQFLMGRGKQGNQVYVVDMGVAIEIPEVDFSQNPTRPQSGRLAGTAYFASVNAHLGIGETPRDDMEAIGYLLIYFLRGTLPWHEELEKGRTRGSKTINQINKVIWEIKSNLTIEKLCNGLPKEFAVYLNHVRSLSFHDKPNYALLRRQFKNLFVREGFEYDNVFDWTELKFLMTLQDVQGEATG